MKAPQCMQVLWNKSLIIDIRVIDGKTDLPNTMTNVILTDLIFAFGINPREEARLESSSNRGSVLFEFLQVALRKIPSRKSRKEFRNMFVQLPISTIYFRKM
jgi:hypothetical protein